MQRYLVEYRDNDLATRTVIVRADVPQQFRSSLETMKPFIGSKLKPPAMRILKITLVPDGNDDY